MEEVIKSSRLSPFFFFFFFFGGGGGGGGGAGYEAWRVWVETNIH